jgi:hypothetical protein
MIPSAFWRWMPSLGSVSFALLLTSCLETKQEYTLNPDGSGKVRHESSFSIVRLNQNNETDNPEKALQKSIAGILAGSKGVDAWTGVSFKQLEDGRTWFQGTAYFKKLADLEIPNQNIATFAWENQGNGRAELTVKQSDGTSKLEDSGSTTGQPPRSVAGERARFEQSKPLLQAMLAKLKLSVSFTLPGEVAERTNFRSAATDSLELSIEGSKLFNALETLVGKDDSWLAKYGLDLQGKAWMDDELCGLLFGEKAPVKATISLGPAPLFNYAQEVAAARRDSEALQKRLGAVSIAPPANGEPLKSIRVVGVQWTNAVDEKLLVRPFGSREGYTLSVLAEFPGSVLDLTGKSALISATANDGSSLLKGDQERDRRIGFPSLSADKASVIFEINLKLPGPRVTGIKEISGILQYRVAGGTKEVDLGLTSLKTGIKGTSLGASIEKLDEVEEGSHRMELKVKLEPNELKAAYLVADGGRSELRRNGYSSSNGITTFNFDSTVPYPEHGTVVLELQDKLQTFNAPFRIENLSVLGIPQPPGQ